MAFSPGASTNYIFCAKKYPFLTLGLGLRLQKRLGEYLGVVVNDDVRWC